MWNYHFTNCWFSNNGDLATPTASLELNDMVGLASGSNTVCLTNCEWEDNNGTAVYVGGDNASALGVGVVISTSKFERNDGHSVHFKASHGCGVMNSYILSNDISLASVRFEEPTNQGSNWCVANAMTVSGTTKPNHVRCSSTGQCAVITGNAFYGVPSDGTGAILLDSGYGQVAISGNALVDWSSTRQMTTDNRTTKSGTVQHTTGRTNFYDGVGIKSVAGTPTDASFTATPPNSGAAVLAWDNTNNRLYVRKPDGSYKSILLS